MVFAILLLLTGLTISSVAIYYSVMGLTAIFAAAYYPIIVMGVSLELAKLVAATWLKAYWSRIPILLKSYMLVAVILLMMITSMGIFGFLSKAHSDQTLVSGDVLSKLAVIDEQIKTSKDNIETNRKALQQMDAQVDQMLGRTDSERGAERSVQIRRNQAKERARLQSEITVEQKRIAKLNEERSPIAAENRKIEAEVGPIKYIAKFIYNDDPDANILEKAVTWVIIMIVIVFDPLAVLLLIASQMSFFWWRDDRKNNATPLVETVEDVKEQTPITEDVKEQTPITENNDIIKCPKCGTDILWATAIGPYCPNRSCDVIDNIYGYQLQEEVTSDSDSSEKILKELDELALAKEEKAQPQIPVEVKEVEDVKLDPWPWPKSENIDWADDHEEMSSDLEELKESNLKKKWKDANPDVNLKEIKHLYAIGAIDKLPWKEVEKLDAEASSYEPDNGPLTDEQIEQLKTTASQDMPQGEVIAKSYLFDENLEEDQKKNYIHSQDTEQPSTDGENREVAYVQNQEQTETSIWNRIKK